MKTLKVEDDVWKYLMEIKLELGKKNASEVIKYLCVVKK